MVNSLSGRTALYFHIPAPRLRSGLMLLQQLLKEQEQRSLSHFSSRISLIWIGKTSFQRITFSQLENKHWPGIRWLSHFHLTFAGLFIINGEKVLRNCGFIAKRTCDLMPGAATRIKMQLLSVDLDGLNVIVNLGHFNSLFNYNWFKLIKWF